MGAIYLAAMLHTMTSAVRFVGVECGPWKGLMGRDVIAGSRGRGSEGSDKANGRRGF